jgi:hypothetical protein
MRCPLETIFEPAGRIFLLRSCAAVHDGVSQCAGASGAQVSRWCVLRLAPRNVKGIELGGWVRAVGVHGIDTERRRCHGVCKVVQSPIRFVLRGRCV